MTLESTWVRIPSSPKLIFLLARLYFCSGSTNPYLDFDNTHGFGPEHYIAAEDSTIPGATNIYGTYQIRVEYYADHSGADTPQAITWHLNVKYLAFKDQSTGQEYWVQESRSGALSTPSSSDTGDFES